MTPFNECAIQAQAFLHGHLDVGPVASYHEQVVYHGRTYLIHPPLAALLMVPFVWAVGVGRAQPWGAAAIYTGIVLAAWRLLREVMSDAPHIDDYGYLIADSSDRLFLRMASHFSIARAWLTAFFALGTIVLWATLDASSWHLVILAAILPTLLALNETFGKCRPWLVAGWASIAVAGRSDLVLGLPFFFFLTVRDIEDAGDFISTCAIVGVCLAAYNYARFDSFVDRGIFLFVQHDGWMARMGGGSPLALRFAPTNLYSVFFSPPAFMDHFPWIHPVMNGQALIFTSPAFLLALNARPTRKNMLLFGAALAVMLPSICWYGNGFSQFGCRFWMQSYPFLLVLTARGWVPQLGYVLVIASIVLVSLGTYQAEMWGLAP